MVLLRSIRPRSTSSNGRYGLGCRSRTAASAGGLGDDLPTGADYDQSGCGAHVDPVVDVTEVAVDRVVLFEPAIHRREVQAHEASQGRIGLPGGGVGPRGDGRGDDPITDIDAPTGSAVLVWFGGGEAVLVKVVVEGVVVLGQVTRLVEHDAAGAVQHGGPGEHGPYAARPRLPVADLFGDREIERASL